MRDHMTQVTRIDVMADIPSGYPQPCYEMREVKEVLLVEHLACVLMRSGLARCYDARDGKLVCELNPVDRSTVHFAAVHTMVHNPSNDTLIIAYSSLPAHLQCKVVLLQSLKMGKLESYATSHQFECVVLRHPAFFEFCGMNKRIGAADLYKHVYRFWDMTTYELVFEIQGNGYQEMRVSDGVVVMLSQPRQNFIPLSLYDIEDGKLLVDPQLLNAICKQATREIEIVQHRELQFLELLVTQLLIKQQGGPIRAYDILRGEGFTVNDTNHFRPSGFVFYDVRQRAPADENDAQTNDSVDASEPTVFPRHKLAYRPRKFFTISRTCIEFWELTRYSLRRTRQLFIQGMDNPDICCHSLWANLLFVRAHQVQPFDENGSDEPLMERFRQSTIYFQKPLLRNRSDRVHTPTKAGPGCCEVDIFAADIDVYTKHSVLLFSLDGSSYFGKIDREVCGAHLRSLAVSQDLSVIACGNNAGIVRLVRMPNQIQNYHCQNEVSLCG
ncbi:hypothetical protein, conserved [Babesia bigemina]|uniref:Uncharacterized protein n=1 Tax=Babesia bigemina TaxID=5866 RepID=A0A061CZS9_BABBI|nr:hypothetical protein, conserved [Babesia bigemina]CDR94121.1 hypothetical protein, conserved [Babesia bigemina]|eukprot:XP_012766307.1 hypothetical protein, conserved [Babesia bigemina]